MRPFTGLACCAYCPISRCPEHAIPLPTCWNYHHHGSDTADHDAVIRGCGTESTFGHRTNSSPAGSPVGERPSSGARFAFGGRMHRTASATGLVRQNSGFPDREREQPGHQDEREFGSPVDTVAVPTVLLADSQPAIRHGVRAILERSGGISVVGEAATLGEVLAETSRCRPDVLVVDPLMDEPTDGMQVITQVLRLTPSLGVLVFSSAEDDKAVTAAFHAGARGYLAKRADAGQILRGIHAVAAGEAIVDRYIAGRLSALIRTAAGQRYYPFPQLTHREREVLERIAAGKSNANIARELALASKTISNRISAIFGKLGVADRAQAIVLARDAGLGQGEF
ncbi:response regulator [Kitasatospora sp. NPDC058965]|uniref:response regulator n=1 Tax=Kitasatospora sp. NPDC058965 TaxID=3346682 RepID=UPI003699899A